MSHAEVEGDDSSDSSKGKEHVKPVPGKTFWGFWSKSS